ncbi:hypothetical protein [Pseudooceanicola sp. 200-1SW]|uniref:hypothetical protein n=1 Tax=Pseudooceanicola sp. 200-1SW TaxID=3425949 RepID=UPI003D7F1F55
MVLIHSGGSSADYEFGLLTRILALLDVELLRTTTAMRSSPDPESDGLCDLGEFLIGSGFIAAQRYLNATRVDFGLSKAEAYEHPPLFRAPITVAQAINTISNYWKHFADWDEAEQQGIDPRAKGQSAITLRALDKMALPGSYPCADVLSQLQPVEALSLEKLLPLLTEWRNSLMAQSK